MQSSLSRRHMVSVFRHPLLLQNGIPKQSNAIIFVGGEIARKRGRRKIISKAGAFVFVAL
jgi:hypothetical protein